MHPAYMVPKRRTGKELSPAANTAAARADEKGWAPENMPPPTPTRRGAGPEYYGGLPGPSSWWLDVNANRDTEYRKLTGNREKEPSISLVSSAQRQILSPTGDR